MLMSTVNNAQIKIKNPQIAHLHHYGLFAEYLTRVKNYSIMLLTGLLSYSLRCLRRVRAFLIM